MYVVSFDESMNSVTQNEQMNISVPFWHPTKNRVEVRYLDSMFLGHTAARNLLHNFNLATSKRSAPNMIQVSMDGPNVNWAFYNLLLKSREEKELSSLVAIGSCGLHIMHGAFKAGAEATGWNVAKRLKALWTLFRDTPARRDDYVEYTGSSVFPLQFCARRWIEDEPVALRAVEIWENVKKIVRYWESLPKSKQPSSNCYMTVRDAMNDEFAIPKFQFFSSIAALLKPFLTAYQTDAPILPYLYDDLLKLVRELMSWFIKDERMMY